MADGETFGAWLSGDLLKRAKKRAGGNNSRYVRELIERDLEGELDLTTQNVLIELSRKFHPGLVGEMTELCTEPDGTPRISQSKLLGRLLEATALALRAQREIEKSFPGGPKTKVQAELGRLRQIEDSFFQIAATIGSYTERTADQDKQAAEPKTTRADRNKKQDAGTTGPTLLPHDQNEAV